MKKVFFAFVAASALVFAACNNKPAETPEATADTTKVEQPAATMDSTAAAAPATDTAAAPAK